MFDRIIESSVRNKGIVFVLTIGVLLAGWAAFQNAPRKEGTWQQAHGDNDMAVLIALH